MFLFLRTRFPVVPLFLYTFLTSCAVGAWFGINKLPPILVVAFVYLGFLFHLRVLDEHKDFYYDSAHHADRPVQKGSVTLSALARWGVINGLVMMSFMDAAAPRSVVFVFFIGLLYTALMYFEFFSGEWLRLHIGWYMVSHQIVFIPIFLSFYGVFAGGVWLPGDWMNWAHLAYLILPVAILEVGRKLAPRYSANGQETDDTYRAQWGEKRSVEVFCLLVITTCAAGVVASGGDKLGLLGVFGLLGILVSVVAMWQRRILVKYSMAVTVAIVLLLPLLGMWL